MIDLYLNNHVKNQLHSLEIPFKDMISLRETAISVIFIDHITYWLAESMVNMAQKGCTVYSTGIIFYIIVCISLK